MRAAEPAIALPERYAILHRVAAGGMATVWAAEDRMLGRRVAVKVLADVIADDASARTRFLREARAGARLSDHPHVVTVFDLGEHDGRAYMVMELMAGGTVALRMASGRRPPQSLALRWLHETADALDAAHALDIVHRDVKPANLLLDERNRLAVGDFGIASVAGEAPVTQAGIVLGTASYLAPEQALGHPATAASDRYALAVVAFELLTGRKPFDGGPAAAQARAHVEQEPPAASQIDPTLPPAADAALRRGLAKDPQDRPPTATALVEELERAVGADVTATTRVHAATAPPAAVAVAAPPRRPREPAPPSAPPAPVPATRRARWPALVAVLAALALVAGALAALLSGGDPGGSERAGAEPTAAQTERARTTSRQERARPTTGTAQQSQPETTPAPAPAPAGDPVALNDQAYALFRQGDYAEAVPLLERSVAAFRDQGRTDELAYAFALYNLGASLNRAGRPAEAIPYLEERLRVSDNQRGVVEAELADARAKLGGEEGDDDGKPGKGSKKGKQGD